MIVALFLLTAGAVMADSVPGNDPNIGVKGGHHSIRLTSDNFSFTINGQGGGVFDFLNDTNTDWITVTLFASAPIDSSFTCNPTQFGHLFENCSTTVTSQNHETGQEAVTVFFSGTGGCDVTSDNPGCFPGIKDDSHFFFNLNNDFNCQEECNGGWTPNFTVQGGGNLPPSVPEPASIFLVLTGLGGIVARRRRSAYLARRS
jgi:hypothetical protein